MVRISTIMTIILSHLRDVLRKRGIQDDYDIDQAILMSFDLAKAISRDSSSILSFRKAVGDNGAAMKDYIWHMQGKMNNPVLAVYKYNKKRSTETDEMI